jgi:hypothetical protein
VNLLRNPDSSGRPASADDYVVLTLLDLAVAGALAHMEQVGRNLYTYAPRLPTTSLEQAVLTERVCAVAEELDRFRDFVAILAQRATQGRTDHEAGDGA